MSDCMTARGLKNALLSGIAVLALPGFAMAQDTTISDAQTTPVLTSDVGNLTIDANGSITIDTGTAVTVDSDNTVAIDGTITGGEGDGVTGTLITGDRTFTYTQTGAVSLIEAAEPEDEVAPDFSNDRFGLRIAAGSYTGDVTFSDTADILIDGDNSAAVFVEGNVVGDFTMDGDISLRGADSVGIGLIGDRTGDVFIGSLSTVTVQGERTNALTIAGDVTGNATIRGTLNVTAFEDTTPDADITVTDAAGNETTEPDPANAVQAALVSGHGIELTGNVTEGVLIDGGVTGGFEVDDPVNDAAVTVLGSGNALRIDGGAAGITLGLVQQEVFDSDMTTTTMTTDSGDVVTRSGLCPTGEFDTSGVEIESADACDQYGQYGLINRGSLRTSGIYEGVAATTVYLSDVTIEGGIRNDQTIESTASHANARGLVLDSGTTTPLINNVGRLAAGMTGDGGNAVALSIETGASVLSIVNQSRIEASTISDSAESVAIRDLSGTVTSVRNTGVIIAQRRDETEDADETLDPQVIAMDFGANTSGVSIVNTVIDNFDPDSGINRNVFGNVFGNVITGSGDDLYFSDSGTTIGNLTLGAGDDRLDLSQAAQLFGSTDFGDGDGTLIADNAGIFGDVSFGVGNHSITLSADSVLRGTVTSLGMLDVAVTGSSFILENIAALSVNTLTLVDDADGVSSVLGVAVAEDGSSVSRLDGNTISIADGTEIRAVFSGAFDTFGSSDSDRLSQVILSGDVDVNLDTLVLNSAGVSPFLFEQTVSLSDDGNDDVVLTLRRKEATELGIDSSMGSALDPVISTLTGDEALGAALFNTTTEDEFLDAFNQVVAGPLDAPLAYARAQNSSMTSLVSQRIELLGERDDLARTAWLQQQSYFVDREAADGSNGFDGGGFVLALGADMPLGELDVIGIAGHLASSRYDEQLGEDFPFNRLTYGVDIYAAEDFGAIEIDGRVGIAQADSDSERNIVFGGVRRQVTGEWEGTQLTANGRIRYRRAFENKLELTPFASVDYISLDEDAYVEDGDDALALNVAERSAESVRGNVGVSVGKVYDLRPSAYDTGIPGTIIPKLTVAYSHEFATDDIEATYNFEGGDAFTLLSTPESGAAVVGGDIDYENQYAKINVGASGSFGDNINTYTLRVGVGLKW